MGGFFSGMMNMIAGGGNLRSAQQLGRGIGASRGEYESQAGTAFEGMLPTLREFTTAPPGMGALGLGAAETSALQAAGGQTAAAQEAARLHAARTGNIAGLSGMLPAIAEAGSRGSSDAIRNILLRNELLKQQQREMGLRGLEGIYGTAGGLGSSYAHMQPGVLGSEMAARSQKFSGLGQMLDSAAAAIAGGFGGGGAIAPVNAGGGIPGQPTLTGSEYLDVYGGMLPR